MTCYFYAHIDGQNTEAESALAKQYAEKNRLTINQTVVDQDNIKSNWADRKIGQIIKTANPGDTVIVFEAAQIACSTSQMLDFLAKASEEKINILFVKYNAQVNNQSELNKTVDLLNIIGKIESDFISKRTTQALARRKAAGLPLGRPRGRGNKSLKLDRHKDDIKKYLTLGISKASIAKLVDCHPQTLYDWLDRNGIDATDKEISTNLVGI